MRPIAALRENPIPLEMVTYRTHYGSIAGYQNYQKEETEILREYFQMLLKDTIEKPEGEIPNDSYVTLYQIGGSFKRTVRVCDLLDPSSIALKSLPRKNLAITPNSFACGRAMNRKENLFCANVLALDLDFDETQYDWKKVFWFLMKDEFNKSIPTPNFIEHGHRMRLIWVLSEPIRFKKEKYSLLGMIETMLTKWANRLREYGAEYQSPNKYIRLPFSINTKDGSQVQVECVSKEQWTLQDMIDEFLPDLPKGYVKKGIKHQKRKSFSRGLHMKEYNRFRLEDLKTVQAYYNTMEETGHREKLCFLYRNHCLLCHMTEEEARNATLAFNARFVMPLSERDVLQATNNVNKKTYTYSAEQLAFFLDLSEDVIEILNLTTFQKKRAYTKEERRKYNQKYYSEHRDKFVPTRKYQTRKLYKRILRLKEKLQKENKTRRKKINVNNRIQEILEKKYHISVSIKTIESHITKAIKKGEYTPA